MLKKSILICLSLILLLSLMGCNAGNSADDFSFSYIKPNNDSIERGDTLAITIGLTANKTYSWRGSFGEFIAYAHLVCGEGENAYKIYAEPIAFSEEVANYKVKKGESRSEIQYFKIPDDAPDGAYSLYVSFQKSHETYRNVFTLTGSDDVTNISGQQLAAPEDFAIHFASWIDGSQRNIIDTYEGYIQKDLIADGISKKDYNPSYVELCQLYQFVLTLENRTELDYSKPVTYDNYADDEISVSMDPLTCYYLMFTANGKTIEISGDATANECTDQSEEALFFIDAIRGIGNFYRNTEVYKTMPKANGGYE